MEKDGVRLKAKSICNEFKSGISEESSSFFTLNERRVSQWDLRDRRGIARDLLYKCGSQYTGNPNFQCMGVSGNGDLALGSEDGVVSLYSARVLSRAKMKFPSLKQPIRHLDVSYGGSLVLATFDLDLVLLCTLLTNKEGEMKSAFSCKVTKNWETSSPIFLRPTSKDAGLMRGHFLHDGRFSWVSGQCSSVIRCTVLL
jgi:hypothetical protein